MIGRLAAIDRLRSPGHGNATEPSTRTLATIDVAMIESGWQPMLSRSLWPTAARASSGHPPAKVAAPPGWKLALLLLVLGAPTTAAAGEPAGTPAEETRATLRLDNYSEIVASILKAGGVPDTIALEAASLRRFDDEPGNGTRVDGWHEHGQGNQAGNEPGNEPPDGRAGIPVGEPGTLALRAAAVARDPLVVTTTVPPNADGSLRWPMPEGQMAIVAADGSRIELDASNGNALTVEVTIVSSGRRHRLEQPWSAWVPLNRP